MKFSTDYHNHDFCRLLLKLPVHYIELIGCLLRIRALVVSSLPKPWFYRLPVISVYGIIIRTDQNTQRQAYGSPFEATEFRKPLT